MALNITGKVGWWSGSVNAAPSTSLLLDTYTGATGAYSLRKLRAAYTGSAITVRRSSDNTSTNIGFDVNGNLNTTALLSFVGAGSGYVTIWYDQSGNNNNIENVTLSQQPEIVVSGSILTNLGKPSIRFGYVTGGTSYLNKTGLSINATDVSFMYVANKIASGNPSYPNLNTYSIPMCLITNGSFDFNSANNIGTRMTSTSFSGNNPSLATIYNGTYPSTPYAFNTTYLTWHQKVGATIYVGKNNGTLVSGTNGSPSNITSNELWIGRNPSLGDSIFNGYMSEVILYANNQTTNRNGISSNINSYYSIY